MPGGVNLIAMEQEPSVQSVSPTSTTTRRLSLTAMVAIVPGIALLLSVVHEWAYFSALDSDLIRLMRIEDYFAAVLKWLPWTVIFMFAGWTMQYVTLRIEGGMTEEELIASSPTPRFTRFFRGSANWAMRGLVFIGIPLAVLQFPIWLSFLLAVPVLVGWVYIAGWLVGHYKVLGWLSPQYRLAFVLLPALGILIGTFGAWDGTSDLTANQGDRQVRLSNGATMNVLLLRPLKVGLLVRQPSIEQVLLIPWADVKVLRQPSALPPATKTGCLLFEMFCKNEGDGS